MWLNQAEGPLCFPSISTEPSIEPGIDDSLYRLKKGEICKQVVKAQEITFS